MGRSRSCVAAQDIFRQTVLEDSGRESQLAFEVKTGNPLATLDLRYHGWECKSDCYGTTACYH
jgi:hypothetical protein